MPKRTETKNNYVNREYKDTLFRQLFQEKKNLLQLYNAVNNTQYKNVEDLEIVTLENAVYLNVKNDLAFVIDFQLHLYEHQASVNPNMPLRFLQYVSNEYEKLIEPKLLYRSKLLQIPSPHFVVFYNGREEQPEIQELRLSDAYVNCEKEPKLELKVMVLNINKGKNQKLKEQCQSLKEYMLYVERVRNYAATMHISEAVEKAITECIKEGILSEFLKKNRAEAKRMSIFECDTEEVLELIKQDIREEAREEGIKEGREEGIKIGKIEERFEVYREMNLPKQEILEKLAERFKISCEEAEDFLNRK